MKKIIIIPSIIFVAISFATCKHDIPLGGVPDPGTGGGTGGGTGTGSTLVCFESEVLPIFLSNCAKSGCHDAASRQKGYVFDSYSNIVREGIVPGRATNSKVYKVLFESGDDRMPRQPNPPLTAAQKAIIGKWINEGAKNTINCGTACDTTSFTYSGAISVIISNNCTGCHSGTSAPAGINLTSHSNVQSHAISGRLWAAVTHAPGYSPMPKNAAKLSECHLTQIRKWIDAGALNN